MSEESELERNLIGLSPYLWQSQITLKIVDGRQTMTSW
jgi:hypothetical protein